VSVRQRALLEDVLTVALWAAIGLGLLVGVAGLLSVGGAGTATLALAVVGAQGALATMFYALRLADAE
jgi:amino acid permease